MSMIPNKQTPEKSRGASIFAILAGMAGLPGAVMLMASAVMLTAALLLAVAAAPASAGSPAQTADEGSQIFQQRCAACHTIGGGKQVGPDLQGVTQRRDLAWIKRFITEPDKVIAGGDPIATQLLQEYNNVPMPNLGLAAGEVDSLVAYLENPGAAASAGPLLPAGRASIGLQLFTGEQPLANGGTPCFACHSVQGITALGGGALGPDLTKAYTRFGDAGLAGALAGLPFPTMQGVFLNRDLTPQEQSDLASFLKIADSSAPAGPAPLPTWVFWTVGSIGVLILFGVLFYFWPRQRMTANEILKAIR